MACRRHLGAWRRGRPSKAPPFVLGPGLEDRKPKMAKCDIAKVPQGLLMSEPGGNSGGGAMSEAAASTPIERLRARLGLPQASPSAPHYLFYRHALLTRLTHWANALILFVMLTSGLQIFNAHPALYWGRSADFDHPALSLTAQQNGDTLKGVTQIGDWHFSSTGFLGASAQEGQIVSRGFPSWATIPADSPSLALGRLWHFAFAWLFV